MSLGIDEKPIKLRGIPIGNLGFNVQGRVQQSNYQPTRVPQYHLGYRWDPNVQRQTLPN